MCISLFHQKRDNNNNLKQKKMKNLTANQIENLISYHNNSAYASTKEITEVAEEVIEEGEELENVENEIQNQLDQELIGFEYIECENQGSFKRHIWHKIEE